AAIDYNNLIMNQWPGTESEKHALATLYGVYQRVGDAANASVALAGLRSKFPGDAVTALVSNVASASKLFQGSLKASTGFSSLGKAVGPPLQTSQKKEDGASIPHETELFRPYPNPFNPSTTISYALSVPGHVRLAIYDVLGREIDELLNEYETEGTKSTKFDGSRFPSGMYYVSLEVSGRRFVQRLLMLK
ncbi:MAG: T9SS type A sorting domain-containing protein, partial [Bacteroidota bacterium]